MLLQQPSWQRFKRQMQQLALKVFTSIYLTENSYYSYDRPIIFLNKFEVISFGV